MMSNRRPRRTLYLILAAIALASGSGQVSWAQATPWGRMASPYAYGRSYYTTPYASRTLPPSMAPRYSYAAPAYTYMPASSFSGGGLDGHRYLDDFATGRGLPLAKPWMKPLR